jgi:hypothetical protein
LSGIFRNAAKENPWDVGFGVSIITCIVVEQAILYVVGLADVILVELIGKNDINVKHKQTKKPV